MKIQYCSDLHLEFPENKLFLEQNPMEVTGDILILAGDIIPFKLMDKHHAFFDFLSGSFESVYWLPGNHEYYYDDAAKRSGAFCEKIRSNVFLVNNFSAAINNTQFIFSTLWTDISAVNQWQIQQSMSDFQVIQYNDERFSTIHANKLHQQSRQFLNDALSAKSAGKKVVVTHHVPTFLNYPEKYKGGVLNEAFAVELYDFIETHQPDYWVYGHHHYNTPDFKIADTQLLTNQLGYVRNTENAGFNHGKVIEIASIL